MNSAAVAKAENAIGETHARVLEELKNAPSERERFAGRGIDAQLALQQELLKGRAVKDQLQESVAFITGKDWIPARDVAEKLLKLPGDAIPVVRRAPVVTQGNFPRPYEKVDVKFIDPDSVERLKEALDLPTDAKKLLGIPVDPKDIGQKGAEGASVSYTFAASPDDRKALMRQLLESSANEEWALTHSTNRTSEERFFARCGAIIKGVVCSAATYTGIAALSFGSLLIHSVATGNKGGILFFIPTVFSAVATLFNGEKWMERIKDGLYEVDKAEEVSLLGSGRRR